MILSTLVTAVRLQTSGDASALVESAEPHAPSHCTTACYFLYPVVRLFCATVSLSRTPAPAAARAPSGAAAAGAR
eukprot:7352868-Pyramimonas_sp.AAC.1